MIRVALSQRICSLYDVGEVRDCLDERLNDVLMSLGLLPMPMPNFAVRNGKDHSASDDWLSEVSPEGVILTGGDDPRIRDRRWWAERALISYARSRELPLLGICRGMQRLVLEDSGTIARVRGHVNTRHFVTSRREPVNSFHEFRVVNLPEIWSPEAYSDDGVLEAITHSSLPWQGWMWHPERDTPTGKDDLNALARLFNVGLRP